ncbi:MAG: hypothetical protein IPF82_18455 [Blastocatellia bacterium]|nr:hypothetical protein [Blastocatellia bacterium]
MSSDFKDVLRERVEGLVRARMAEVEGAVESARQEIGSVLERLHGSTSGTSFNLQESPALDQISAEIAAQVGQAAAESSRLSGDLALLRDSVVDIDSQSTQADVLNALVERAYNFAPRVVLFVVKGDDAIAWAARGFDDELGDDAVRGLSVALGSDTMLGAVLHGQTTFLGEPLDQKDNGVLLDRLGSIKPERISGIPLRVRSKTVGILYADSYDTSVGSIGIEALELLVHSAGIIVELASLRQRIGEPGGRSHGTSSTAPLSAVVRHAVAPAAVPEPPPVPVPAPVEIAAPPAAEAVAEPDVLAEAPVSAPQEGALPVESGFGFEVEPEPEALVAEEPEPQPEPAPEPEPAMVEPAAEPSFVSPEPDAWAEPEILVEPQPMFELPAEPAPSFDIGQEAAAEPEYEITIPPDGEPSEPAPSPFELSAEPAPADVVDDRTIPVFSEPPPVSSVGFVDEEPTAQWTPQPVVSASAPLSATMPPAAGELSPEEEKLHNDARRFARLLVSEIKLYNEQAVAEGRSNNDLYERLKDDIDRSRQMYDKRVAAVVADRFDYFYDELMNTLAEGEPAKLGPDCPGPTV